MDEPRGPAATLPMIASPKRARNRRIVAAAIPVAVIVALVAAHTPLMGFVMRRRAAALGFELDYDSAEVSRGSVRLDHARVTLTGVRGLRVTAGAVILATSWLSVTSVDAEGVAVTVEGPASERVLDLASWSSEYPDAYRLRGSANDLRVEWRARPDTPAWLTIGGGRLTADGNTARFQAATSSAFGVPVGAIGATFAVEATGLTIEAGKKPGGEAAVVATLRSSARPPELTVTLRPVELAALGTALGVSLPAHGAIARGSADVKLGRAPDGVTGTASLDLDGWVPSHPGALDGIIFGHKTTLRSRLSVSEDRATVRLDDLEVRAGKLDLKGSGTITETGNHATVHVEIGGPIPCSDLARSVAKDELGGLLGGLAGDMAGRAVSGSAVVHVTIDGDARDLGAAKVKPKVGVGCQLKLPGL